MFSNKAMDAEKALVKTVHCNLCSRRCLTGLRLLLLIGCKQRRLRRDLYRNRKHDNTIRLFIRPSLYVEAGPKQFYGSIKVVIIPTNYILLYVYNALSWGTNKLFLSCRTHARFCDWQNMMVLLGLPAFRNKPFRIPYILSL